MVSTDVLLSAPLDPVLEITALSRIVQFVVSSRFVRPPKNVRKLTALVEFVHLSLAHPHQPARTKTFARKVPSIRHVEPIAPRPTKLPALLTLPVV